MPCNAFSDERVLSENAFLIFDDGVLCRNRVSF